MIGGHLSIHSNQNLHMSANDELALISQNNLLLSTKQSLGLRSDENLTINIKDLFATSKQDMSYNASNSITLCVGDSSSIEIHKDSIILKIKDNEFILDESGLHINTKMEIKK